LMRITKLAIIRMRNSCLGSSISDRTRTRCEFGSTTAPTVEILPPNTRPECAKYRDLDLLPDTKGRAVALGDVGQHPQGVDGNRIWHGHIARPRQPPGRGIAHNDQALRCHRGRLGAADHVAIKPERIRQRAAADAPGERTLEPGAARVVEFVGDWAFVARDGQRVGFVPAGSLVALH
jgi:hypothetical protein